MAWLQRVIPNSVSGFTWPLRQQEPTNLHYEEPSSKSTPMQFRNPTPRQRVDPSSPFYYQALYPETGNPTSRQRVDLSCPFYTHEHSRQFGNPTPRQRVDPSSPLYPQAFGPKMANPTPRQRVDPSNPLYLHDHSHAILESHTAAACGSFKYPRLAAQRHCARGAQIEKPIVFVERT